MPIKDWPTLVDLCSGFDEHVLPRSDKLTGCKHTLLFTDGSLIEHTYVDGKTLEWKILGGSELQGKADYVAIEVRPGIFFVDFQKPDYDEEVTFVLDSNSGRAIVSISGFIEVEGKRRTRTTFHDAHLDDRQDAEPFPHTTELIGKHVLYRYTGRDVYEHVYLNQGTFTWHCLSGTEKGLADTEPCKMLKLSDKLYLLFWTEKIMPVESVVVVDLDKMRSTGRFLCWDPEHKKAVHTTFGSYATILAEKRSIEL